eukprot:CAMPEP_0170888426 /NCGR_PEP_ID=MMETSP0734-20130129/38454_1 /TAXON_ID=186038 /ORGANISM="Fragilariopsis kerguelensis, Strain L26-C5" /LENGTH=38 /DNA_ID= /DNA_START= /DNA_END= /DNA_ORIENTATION=
MTDNNNNSYRNNDVTYGIYVVGNWFMRIGVSYVLYGDE